MQCSICNDPIMIEPSGWADGANAWPVVPNGRCCNMCDEQIVIPTRLAREYNLQIGEILIEPNGRIIRPS